MKKLRNKIGFKWQPFSRKQKKVLMWWLPESPHHDKEMIICEGAIRSGKTVSMIDSFMTWSLETHEGQNFIIAGRTAGALKRNVIGPLLQILDSKGIEYNYNRSENYLLVGSNTYYFFGGATEQAQDVLQGLTAAGAYADEVALLPKSFVDQMLARCSVEGSRYFMNCNPAGPYHWFKKEFIDDVKGKNAYLLHFTMDDNLTLSDRVKNRFKRMFSGVFYLRYILGLWVMAEGVIHDMFDRERHVVPTVDRRYSDYYISIDYGTLNATAFGLWGEHEGKWYKVKEYHYDGRTAGKQKTDAQYADDLEDFTPASWVSVILDPSAASFKAELESRGFHVIQGDNDVVDGIRNVGAALHESTVLYNDCCKETFREFESYVWDKKAGERGEDKPLKQNDHHMDADRYFIRTILYGPEGFFSDQNAF